MERAGGYGDYYLPPGIRFCPTDDELLLCYLRPKANGEVVLGENVVIFDSDLYGEEPWKIWEKFKKKRAHDLMKNKDLYFFTQLNTKNQKGSRKSRIVGKGTWKGENSADAILDAENKRKIGSKKRFSYKSSHWPEHNGRWIMHEYYLDPSLLMNTQQEKEAVICILRKNDDQPLAEKKRKREWEEDRGMLAEYNYFNARCHDDHNTRFADQQEKFGGYNYSNAHRHDDILSEGDADQQMCMLLAPQEKRQCVLPPVDDHLQQHAYQQMCMLLAPQEKLQCVLPPVDDHLQLQLRDQECDREQYLLASAEMELGFEKLGEYNCINAHDRFDILSKEVADQQVFLAPEEKRQCVLPSVDEQQQLPVREDWDFDWEEYIFAELGHENGKHQPFEPTPYGADDDYLVQQKIDELGTSTTIQGEETRVPPNMPLQ